MKLQILVGSVREERESLKIAEWFSKVASEEGSFDEVEILDLKDWDLPMEMEATTADNRKKTEDYKYEYTRKWSTKIKEGDAYIFVTPEYNHGYSAPLKNAIDHLYYEWAHKPAAMVSLGGVGGARVIEALLPVLIAVQITPIAYSVRLSYKDVEGETVHSNQAVQKAKGLLIPLAAYSKALQPVREQLNPH